MTLKAPTKTPLTTAYVIQIWDKLFDEDFFAQTMMDYEDQETELVVLDLSEMNNSGKFDCEEAIRSLTDAPRYAVSAITEILKREYPTIQQVSVVIRNYKWCTDIKHKIREMRSANINKAVIFEGVIRSSTPVLSKLKSMAYECGGCRGVFLVEQDGDIEGDEPEDCPLCSRTGEIFTHDEMSDVFINYIECEIEEEPEGLGGKQPERVQCQFSGALTEERIRTVAGNRASFFGVHRVKKKEKKSLIYEKYLEILGAEKKGRQYEEMEISEENKKEFEEMSKSPTLMEDMAKSIAPNIFGYDMEKHAILLQMFGGNLYSERRGDIHILLVGEPGIGKSSLTKNITAIAPHVVKASGAPTTSVGLSACVRRDESVAGGYVVEAGAAVLASGGILLLDELDKMDKEVSGALHEIMEDQTISLNKANISTQLVAKCSILGIMNPKNNRFLKDEKTSEQIDLPASLVSRFDLVFALKDIVDETKDEKITEAIDRARDGEEITYIYSPETVTKYIQYARSKVKELKKNKEAKKIMAKKYIKIRQSNKGSEAVAITSRQYEGISRLAEAHAKMRLSSEVNGEDAKAALKIMEYYLHTMCLDPGTGELCIDTVMGGKCTSEKNRDASLLEVLVEIRSKIMIENPDLTGAECLIDIEYAQGYFIDKWHTEKEFKKGLDSLASDMKITLQRGQSKIKIERDR